MKRSQIAPTKPAAHTPCAFASITPPEQFITQSLYQSAFCLCRGLRLVGKKSEGQKVSLIFEGDSAGQVAMEFYAGAPVSAKLYADNYRTLKDFVFEK